MDQPRHLWVQITASSVDGMPEEVDHILTRGAHPSLKLDPANLRGMSAAAHRRRHAGKPVPPATTLHDIW